MNRMAEASSSLYVEQVLNLLEEDPDDNDEFDEVFFPGSDVMTDQPLEQMWSVASFQALTTKQG